MSSSAACFPASLVIFGDVAPMHMCITIWVFIAFGVAYAFVGGVSKPAIWTDVLQVSVSALRQAARHHRGAAPSHPHRPRRARRRLANPPQGGSKLTALQTGLDFSKPWRGFDPGGRSSPSSPPPRASCS
jgi:hypothetical protein